jgi:hypothetical protein
MMTWERAYVAVSAALGEPLADALGSLEDDGIARAAPLPEALRSGDKSTQAQALAESLLELAREIDAGALR